jgi:hypothetical protein
MKKLFLSALIMGTAAVAANAQANSILMYGQIGYHSSKDETGTNKNRAFNINPGIGYQFDNNWTVGVTGSFQTSRNLDNSLPNANWHYTNTYSAGVFLRHTMPIGKVFALYSQLEAGYIGSTQGVSDVPNSSLTSNGFRASFMPAIGVNIVDGFAMNFGFGGIDYTTMKTSGAPGSSSAFNFTWGSQFNIGVSRNLFCGKHKHHGMKMNHGNDVDKQDMKDDDNDN